eukprot:COSAG01_NODE_7343_length_3242_cov_19.776010_1_plen_53_part_00
MCKFRVTLWWEGALVTADLDTLTILHTHTLCIHPKNVLQRSSALARVIVFPQ